MIHREKIDELRELLELHDRSVLSIVGLNGMTETTQPGDIIRTLQESGDRAFVFVGPKEKLQAEWRENPDGTVTYTLTVGP